MHVKQLQPDDFWFAGLDSLSCLPNCWDVLPDIQMRLIQRQGGPVLHPTVYVSHCSTASDTVIRKHDTLYFLVDRITLSGHTWRHVTSARVIDARLETREREREIKRETKAIKNAFVNSWTADYPRGPTMDVLLASWFHKFSAVCSNVLSRISLNGVFSSGDTGQKVQRL